ncbi:MAG: cation:proton antiporter [Myxococcota bacterium]
MSEAHLLQFALLLGVLGLAAAISVVLRMPVVPFYIAAGVAIGGRLAGDEVVRFLGHLGVVFLLFAMGLEFSLRSVRRQLGRFIAAGGVDLVINLPIGVGAGLLLGWSWRESLYLGGIVYMTSSAVVSKCIVDFGRAARPETETVLRLLVFEDLTIAIYMVALAALWPIGDETQSAAHVVWALARSAAFVAVLALLASRLQRPLERLLASQTDEGFTLALVAFVLGIAAAAIGAGLSAEIGAFLAGLVLGSTGLKERAARTLWPFQTLFAALFFVSFGMGIDLGQVSSVLVATLCLVALGLASKTASGYLAGRISGHAPRPSLAVGLSLIPKGEFSIVLATLASASGAGAHGIAALSALYVFILSILGPLLMREADRIRAWLPARDRPRRAREKSPVRPDPGPSPRSLS